MMQKTKFRRLLATSFTLVQQNNIMKAEIIKMYSRSLNKKKIEVVEEITWNTGAADPDTDGRFKLTYGDCFES